jgi:hypothetical protein
MLPETYDPPAEFAKSAVDQPVTPLVARQLPRPKPSVAGGLAAVFRTPVPETTIDKKNHTLSTKHKIGFAEQRLMPPPAGHTTSPQYCHQSKFRSLVPPPVNV